MAAPKSIKSSISLALFATLFLFFHSCKKETIKLSWETLETNTNSDLSSIYFTDENNGHVVGGDTWFSGLYLKTINGGSTWSADNFSDKQLFGLHFNENNIGYSVGINGYLFSSSDPDYLQWNFYRLPRWEILRDVSFNNKNEGALVDGVAFANGAVTLLDSQMAVIQIDTFGHELSAVSYSDDNTIHVVGYGIILRSDDNGENWVESSVTGDFFQAITFPSATTGYIVGYNGTILKTTDNGISWKILRNGDSITVSDQRFRAVHFMDELHGYIAGDDGLCWRTSNGGDNWQIIEGLPGKNFADVFAIGDWVYLAGEEGTLIKMATE